MFKIMKDGVAVGITGAPNYIKLLSNGCYGLCPREEAQGVAFGGTPYQLADKEEMGGLDVVTLEEESDITVSGDHLAAAQVFAAQAEAGSVEEGAAFHHKGLFGAWVSGMEYAAGALRRYGDRLYRCVQAHTSQEGWAPDATPALWAAVADPSEEWPEWVQPTGTQDAYNTGDKVSYNGKHYVCSTDANTWAPDVYGWTEVV